MISIVQLIKIIMRIKSILVILIISQVILFGQLRESLRNEVIIFIKPEALKFPANEKGAINPAKIDIPIQ